MNDLNDSLIDLNSHLTPLAELLRPTSINEIFGQDHILGPGKPLRLAITNKIAHSIIFWGPAGSGKTTLARIVARSLKAKMYAMSAVRSGIKEIRECAQAGQAARREGKATVLFVDEVHRFNKSQQDAFLPYVENGDLIFIGATTENPGFEVNASLLSRLKVYVLKPLTIHALNQVLDRCLLIGKEVVGSDFEIKPEARDVFAQAAGGDARRALNFVDMAVGILKHDEHNIVTLDLAKEIAKESVTAFDKHGDQFYEQISALHKSVRGSDPDASLYWFSRMLEGGCDPLYVARRILRIASEDVGNADPNAMNIALNAWDTYNRLGSPEGELALAQAVVYLACSPKSNAVYMAFQRSTEEARKFGHLEVPLHLRNATTQLSKALGYGKDYRYAHDEPDALAAGENYFPIGMRKSNYYLPVERGVEKRIKAYLDWIRQRKGD